MRALFTYDYGKREMEEIQNLGYDTIIKKEKELEYTEDLKNVEVLVCYDPFSSLELSKMINLKWIQLSSIGIDQVPRELLKAKGITLTNNKGGYSIPMGEFIVLKILEFYKKSHQLREQQMKKEWKMDTSLLELYNKKVTFIGTGSIAIEGARRLQGFGVEIHGVNTAGKPVEYFDRCHPIKELNKVLAFSDVVVLTIPYTEDTHHLLGEKSFDLMKESALLINVSRGSIIDESALINALKKEEIHGAALDVFEKEPLSKEHPLWNFKNAVITPHNSWISEMRNQRRYDTIYENLKRYRDGRPLINIVDLDKGY